MKQNPTQLDIQSYLMNFPFTLDTKVPNNVWMEELKPEDLLINKNKAYKQFLDLYNFIAGSGLVYILPSYGDYQDQVYVANVGMVLTHNKKSSNVILANYTSEPRQGEEIVAKKFFELMDYKTHLCPHKWEGEADLKYLRDNVYVGGYGIRSDIKAYEWMEKEFDMEIIKVEMVEDYLYHLDCSIFPLNKNKSLICTELYTSEEIKLIEKYTEIIDINVDDAFGGITNSARLGNMILCASNISELSKHDEFYKGEKQKIETLENICSNEGMEPIIFNMSEYMKSGAMLSCCLMSLNHVGHNKSLI